jgi:hypothetical protein
MIAFQLVFPPNFQYDSKHMVVFVVEMDVRKTYELFFYKSINKLNGFTKRELMSFIIILWGEKKRNNIHNVQFRKTFFFCFFFFFFWRGRGKGKEFWHLCLNGQYDD